MAEQKKTPTKPTTNGHPIPLLKLETLQPNALIEVDGKTYELVTPARLGLLEANEVQKLSPQIRDLWRMDRVTDDNAAALEMLLDRYIRIIFKAPSAVIDKLAFQQRIEIAAVFIRLQRPSLRTVGALTAPKATATAPKRRPTGAKSSRTSRGSTAAIPSAG